MTMATSYPAAGIAAAIAHALAATNDRANPALDDGVIHTCRALWVWEASHELARLVGDAGDMATRRWIDNFFTVVRSLHSSFYEDRAHADDS